MRKRRFRRSSIRRWSLPVTAAERRPAAVLQIILLIVFIDLPAVLWPQIAMAPSKTGFFRALLETSVLGAPALMSFVLLRKGRLRSASRLFVGGWLASTLMSYASTGMAALPQDFGPYVILFLAGYLLGRRWLWATFGMLCSALCLALFTDFIHSLPLMSDGGIRPFNKAIQQSAILACVAVMIDQTIVGLRLALDQSRRRQRQLRSISVRLRNEISRHDETHRRLTRLHRLDAASRMAMAVTHDLGNLVGIIVGYVSERETLADQGTNALLSAMKGIETAALRAQALNARLLSFGKNAPTQGGPMNMVSAIESLSPILSHALGPMVRLIVDIKANSIAVRFDPVSLDLIVINLALNAREAMPSGGTVLIRLRVLGGTAVLTVSDTGRGLSEDEQQQIFTPFRSVGRPSKKGEGLGLAIVGDTIHAAGGTIDVKSIVGRGTTFRIRLPLDTASDHGHDLMSKPHGREVEHNDSRTP